MRHKNRAVIAIAAAVTAVLALAGCSAPQDQGAGGDASSLVIGTLTIPNSLDPKDAGGSSLPYFQAVYDTLIKRAPDGEYTPMLATEWSYDDAKTRLSLTIRDDVTFDDGTALDAEAVKANLDRFRDGGGASAAFLAGVTVEVVDATHVDLVLSAPNPAMVFYLSDAAGLIANPAKFADETALETTPDGTGPYTLNTDRTVIGTTWVYDRRDDYWGDELPFAQLTINGYDNENAIVNGLKTGQIDSALLQQVDQQIAAEGDTNLTLQKTQFDYFGVVLFDRTGAINPAMADDRVRQALNYAIDREGMVETIQQGRATPTSQAWGPDTLGYDASLDDYYTFDPAKAKKLLADAGYADGFELVLPKLPAITSDAVATSMKTSMAEAGITLTWEDVDQATALKQVFVDKKFAGFQLALGQSSNDWVVASTFLLPGTFNALGTQTPETEALMAAARTQEGDAAKATYQELNRYVVEHAWLLPMYRLDYQTVTGPKVTVEQQSGMAVPSIYNYAPKS